MAVRAVQVSLDKQLLSEIDADPEARQVGRSAFIRSAVRLYLKTRSRRQIDEAIALAYKGQADTMLAEAGALMGRQAWPEK